MLGLSLPLGLRREGARVKSLRRLHSYRLPVRAQQRVRQSAEQLALASCRWRPSTTSSSSTRSPTATRPISRRSAPRPESGASITTNRTQQTTLGLSPYIRHQTSKGWTYLVRNDNFWNTYSAVGAGQQRYQSYLCRRRVASYPAELWA